MFWLIEDGENHRIVFTLMIAIMYRPRGEMMKTTLKKIVLRGPDIASLLQRIITQEYTSVMCLN